MQDKQKIPVTFWIISVVGLLWNAMGVFNFGSQMAMTDEILAALPEAQRTLYESTPGWIRAVFGIAVIGGLLGCIGLLMKKAWSIPLFLVSLIAILIQMGYSWFATNAVEAVGPVMGIVMPLVVILIGAFLWYYARSSQRKGWIS